MQGYSKNYFIFTLGMTAGSGSNTLPGRRSTIGSSAAGMPGRRSLPPTGRSYTVPVDMAGFYLSNIW